MAFTPSEYTEAYGAVDVSGLVSQGIKAGTDIAVTAIKAGSPKAPKKKKAAAADLSDVPAHSPAWPIALAIGVGVLVIGVGGYAVMRPPRRAAREPQYTTLESA